METKRGNSSPYNSELGDPNQAARFDNGKPRIELVPTEIIEEMAKVFTYGAQKYDDWNWSKGFPWLQPYASMMRHLMAWHEGEDVDPESGLHHLSHAACNMAMLLHYIKHGIGEDSRLVRVRERAAYRLQAQAELDAGGEKL